MATNHGVRGSNPFLPVKILNNILERWQSWSIASDLKSDEVQASVGSNPTFSVFYVSILLLPGNSSFLLM